MPDNGGLSILDLLEGRTLLGESSHSSQRLSSTRDEGAAAGPAEGEAKDGGGGARAAGGGAARPPPPSSPFVDLSGGGGGPEADVEGTGGLCGGPAITACGCVVV